MEEIGQKLRSAREALGITLEQVEDETKIRRKYLEALEVANEADIPGEVYLKGFLRSYGNYVGLDGTELVEAYKLARDNRDRHSGGAREEDSDQRSNAAATTASAVVPGAALEQQVASAPRPRPAARPRQAPRPRPAPRPRQAPERPRRPPGRPDSLNRRSGLSPGGKLLLVTVVLLAGVAYLGWLIFRQVGPASAPPPAPPQQIKAPDPAPKPADPAPQPPDPAPAPKVTMTRGRGEDVTFTVSAQELQVKLEPGTRPVWFQAEVDGKAAFAGTTTKPLELTGKQIRIRAGHMDGVSVTVNGQRFDKPLDTLTYNLIFNGQ